MAADEDSFFSQYADQNGARRDQCRRYSSRKMTAAAIILKAVVFCICRIVGVPGTRQRTGRRVITAVLGGVRDQDRQRRSRAPAVEHAADQLECISLAPRGRDPARGAALVQLGADQSLIDLQPGSQPVQYRADICAVTLAEQRQRDRIAECIFHRHLPIILISGTSSLNATCFISHTPGSETKVTVT